MFMGPLQEVKPWSTRGVDGVHRFLNRVWRMMIDEEGKVLPSIKDVQMMSDQERILHQTIRKVTDDVETLNFNTAISQMMIFVNEFLGLDPKPRAAMETFVLLLSPFAPHVAEELWNKLGKPNSLSYEAWPKYDESKTKANTVEVIVQVNGKLRAKLQVQLGLEEKQLLAMAFADENIKKYIDGKEIIRQVVVRDKLVSLVIK
jgi:leucyl-tRNA synthetase